MKYYNYNWATREYIGEDDADPDPMQPGNFLLPAYATFFPPPPEVEPGHTVVFDPETNNWVSRKNPPAVASPKAFQQQLDAIPHNLVGDETIGDLFNVQH